MSLEKWSLGYALCKPYVKLVHRFINRKVMVNGLKNLPLGKPVIFAINHQNALLDSLAVLLTTPVQPVWLARADIFSNNLFKRILLFLKMSPVYRIRDGKDQLDKNDAVFDLCINVLEHNKQLAIFPEGTHSGMRQSLAHKKAIPRIAFLAAEKHNFELDIQIVPTGIYYSHYNAFNRYTIVNYGKPIQVKNYKDLYEQSPQEATMALRKEIYDRILELSIEIPSKKYYPEYELLRDILDKPVAKSEDVKLNESEKFRIDKEVIKKVYQSEKTEDASFLPFIESVQQYRKLLVKLKMDDVLLERRVISPLCKLLGFMKYLLLFPVAVYGGMMHYLPFTLPRLIARKKIRDHVFIGTFDIVLAVVLLPVFYLIYGILAYVFTHSQLFTILFIVTLPLFGKAAFLIKQGYTQMRKKIWFESEVRNGNTLAVKAVELRKSIVEKYFSVFN